MEHEMEWKGKYKSELLMVCHMDAQAMYAVGAINEKDMREFDKDCLVSPDNESSVSSRNPVQNPIPVYAAGYKT